MKTIKKFLTIKDLLIKYQKEDMNVDITVVSDGFRKSFKYYSESFVDFNKVIDEIKAIFGKDLKIVAHRAIYGTSDDIVLLQAQVKSKKLAKQTKKIAKDLEKLFKVVKEDCKDRQLMIFLMKCNGKQAVRKYLTKIEDVKALCDILSAELLADCPHIAAIKDHHLLDLGEKTDLPLILTVNLTK